MAGILLLSWVPSGRTIGVAVMWWMQHTLFTDMVGNILFFTDRRKIWYSHYGRQYGFLSKIKNRATIWSSNFTFGFEIFIKRKWKYKLRKKLKTKKTHDHCSIIYNNQDMKTTYMFIIVWIHKVDMIYICVCVYI